MSLIRSSVLVAIVVLNEYEKLKKLLTLFPEEREYTILGVDDGSTDNSGDLLAARCDSYIAHKANEGVGSSIRDAIHYGQSNNFEYIVIMAGNGKMLPSDINKLVDPLIGGKADYVQGSRHLPGGNSPNLPGGRKFAIQFFTLFSNMLLGFKGTDITCGFRAYRLNIFNNPIININQSWLDHYELEYYIHFNVIKNGYRVIEVPVSMIYPAERKNYSKIKPILGWWSIIRPWIYLTLGIKK